MIEKSNIDVLILVALKDELDPLIQIDAHALPDSEWTEVKDETAPYWYRDFLHEGDDKFTVAVARTTKMGATDIAGFGGILIDRLNPGYLAMCGICAGRKDKTNMGDIVVGSSVFDYEKGKSVSHIDEDGNDNTEHLKDTPTFNLRDHILRMIQDFGERPCFLKDINRRRPISYEYQEFWLRKMLMDKKNISSKASKAKRTKNCPDWTEILKRLRAAKEIEESGLKLTPKGFSQARQDKENFPDGFSSDEDIKVVIGSIATGNKVVKDIKKQNKARIFEEIKAIRRDVLAIDMEAYAIGLLAHHKEIPWVVAKGVQDYADDQKNDRYRAFAAHASACFLIEFFHRYLKIESEKKHILACPEEGLPEKHNIPFQRPSSTELVSRDELIASLTDNFITAHQDDFSRFSAVALSGIPGVGKTTVALEIAYRLGRRYPAGVFWIDARNPGNLQEVIKSILKKFKIHISGDENNDQDINASFCHYLETNPCLIFFDALDSRDVAIDLVKFLPKTGLSRVIITTKDSKIELQASLEIIELTILDEIPAIEVLTRFQTLPLTKEQQEIAVKICAELGYLPLALDLAARYLKNKSMALSAYLERLRECGIKWQGLESKNQIKPSIYKVLSLCIEGISKYEKNCDLGLKILHLCAAINLVGDIPSRSDKEDFYGSLIRKKTDKSLPPSKIPLGLASAVNFAGFNQQKENHTLDQFDDAIELLEISGLVRLNPDSDFIWMHTLTYAYINTLLNKEDVEYLVWRLAVDWNSTQNAMLIAGWCNYSKTILDYFNAVSKIEKISENAAIAVLQLLYEMADFCDASNTEEIVDKAISIARRNSNKDLELHLRIDKAYSVYKLRRLKEAEGLYKQLFHDSCNKPIPLIKSIDFMYYYGCLILDLDKVKDKNFTPYLGDKKTHRDFALYLWNNGLRSTIESLKPLETDREVPEHFIFLAERGLYRFFYQKKNVFPEASFSASENELECKIRDKLKPILSDLRQWDYQYILTKGPLHIMLHAIPVRDCN